MIDQKLEEQAGDGGIFQREHFLNFHCVRFTYSLMEKWAGKKKPVQKKNNKPTKQTNKAKVIGTTSCQNIFDNTEKTFQWHLLHIFKCNDAMLF